MNQTTAQFIGDMEAAGFAVRPYAGRFYWKGPAVTSDDLQPVMHATTVPLQWDSLGLGYIVYPKASDDAWYETNDVDPADGPSA